MREAVMPVRGRAFLRTDPIGGDPHMVLECPLLAAAASVGRP